MSYKFAPTECLVATEDVDDLAVENLYKRIVQAKIWTRPIAVERNHMLVMDGHHRLEVAKRLQLSVVPVVLLDYQTVSVTSWRAEDHITPEHIFAMARSGRKFPIKTTRHIFPDTYPGCNVPLSTLIAPPETQREMRHHNRAVGA
ncbi:ParB N-terminal domain-containing protein [Rhizobium oryziradicis]|uniref:Uncharacterized protein n=1 Tax=Rhizobium oryziradicis TaxID=1867956 RepID=A0A1Q8ZKX9_9HYPH|nr:ParB N-terminal domain-containing protein [Rhizobium oryziradicis]OLP42516.1 hypothetical protein BJF95_23285 [Rhizobium oryziradicis]